MALQANEYLDSLHAKAELTPHVISAQAHSRQLFCLSESGHKDSYDRGWHRFKFVAGVRSTRGRLETYGALEVRVILICLLVFIAERRP